MKALSQLTEQDLIVAYLQDRNGETSLSPKQQELLRRYTFCSDLIKQYGTKMKVVPMMVKQFGIDEKTAYRDFFDTQYVFGTQVKQSVDFHLDILLGMYMETYRKAHAIQDFRSAAAVLKLYKDTIKDHMGDKEVVDWSKLNPPPILIAYTPEIFGNLETKEEIQHQLQDLLKKKKKKNIIDIPFEDLSHDPGARS